MELVFIGIVACIASGLTLFSGFGLGTILVPVFALFFPVPIAVAATAVVHLANNIFKFALLARQANWSVVARFGVPAALSALLGAWALTRFDRIPPLLTYRLGERLLEVTAVKAVIGSLIVAFALLELSRRFHQYALPPRWLPVGGLLSGFFGGLSGNQGALRAPFLLKAGLSKEAFVATGVVSAVLVDLARLSVYGSGFLGEHFARSGELGWPVLVATASAFAGAFIGKRMLGKVTYRQVQLVVAAAMLVIGLSLVSGLI